MKKQNYVVHFCRNKSCDKCFIAEDFTNVRDIPPKWRYCPECAKALGIDYNGQRPWNMRSEAEQERIKKFIEAGKSNIKKR